MGIDWGAEIEVLGNFKSMDNVKEVARAAAATIGPYAPDAGLLYSMPRSRH